LKIGGMILLKSIQGFKRAAATTRSGFSWS
jgi:hypothetical protein